MWKQTYGFIALTATLLSAEQSLYSDANRSLYDSPANRAMGGALMAISSEPMPSGLAAGITASDRSTIYVGYSGFYGNLFGATTVGFSHPVDSIQSVGGSVSYLMVPGVDSITIENSGSNVPGAVTNTEQTASELYVNMVYGRELFKFSRGLLTAGGSLHMKRIRLIEMTGYGIGADLSVQSRFNSGVAVALKLENAFTEYGYWTKEYHENGLPRLYVATGFDKDLSNSVAMKIAYRSPDVLGNSGVGGGAFGKNNQFGDEPEELSLSENPGMLITSAAWGTEFSFHKTVAIRAGISDNRMINFGGGVHLFDRWDVDFVYAHSGALDGTYSLSTKISL